MKSKTTYALALLLVVAAGVAANDAQAQTNTQRLATIETVTNSISDVVDDIHDTLDEVAAGIANILTAIAGVQTSVNSVSTQVTQIGTDVTGIKNDVAGLKTDVSGVSSSISNLTGEVSANTAAVNAVGSSVSALNTTMSGIRDSVTSINTSVSGVADSVMSLGTSVTASNEAISSVSESVSTLNTNVSAINERLAALDAKVTNQMMSLGEDSESSAHMKLDMIHAELVRHAAAPQGVSNEVAGSLAMTNARLDSLEMAMQRIESSLLVIDANLRNVEVTVANNTNQVQPRGDITTGKLTREVTAYDYKQADRRGTSEGSQKYHEMNMRFSCNKDVFIDRVDLIRIGGSLKADLLDRNGPKNGTNAVQVNTVSVDDRVLFSNRFNVGSDYVLLHRVADFNNRALVAGTTLPFTAKLYEGVYLNTTGTGSSGNQGSTGGGGRPQTTVTGVTYLYNHTADISSTIPSNSFLLLGANTTRDNKIPLYNIEVNWLTYHTGTTCQLAVGSSGGTTVAGATVAGTLQYSATVTGDGVIKNYSDRIDCRGNPVEITGITTAIAGTWAPGLQNFAKMKLEVMDGADDDVADAELNLVANGAATITKGALPRYSNADLQISGTVPAVNNLLVEIRYLSVANAGCAKE